MIVRKYQAKNVQIAIEKAKKDLGENAVLIQTRNIKSGLLGLTSPQVEIVAAVDDSSAPLDEERNPLVLPQEATSPTPNSSQEGSLPKMQKTQRLERLYSQEGQPGDANDFSKILNAVHKVTVERSEHTLAQDAKIPKREREASERRNAEQYSLSLIGEELSEVRDMLHTILGRISLDNHSDLPDVLRGIYNWFLKNDVEEWIACELAKSMGPSLEGENGTSFYKELKKNLQQLLKTSGELKLDNKGMVVALIGPTGVGKTTTLAKLAAEYHLKRKKKVILATVDTYRIAAVEQLRTYAEILSIPLEVALTPEDLQRAVMAHKEADIILLDTPGRNQKDTLRMHELEAFLNAAKPAETHLLLSTATKNQDLYEILEKFGSLGVNRLLFTKLDETTSFGSILNVAIKAGKPISYFTFGQNVPDDIEVATPGRIATLLLKGMKREEGTPSIQEENVTRPSS